MVHAQTIQHTSWYLSAFEFLVSMINPCWTVTTTLQCPGTHSGPHTCHPIAYPHVQAHSQCITVAPYTSHTVPMNPGPGRHVSALPAHLDHPASGTFGTPPARMFQPHHYIPSSTGMHPADMLCSTCVHIHVHMSPPPFRVIRNPPLAYDTSHTQLPTVMRWLCSPAHLRVWY